MNTLSTKPRRRPHTGIAFPKARVHAAAFGWRIGILLSLACCVAGCATTYRFEVEAFKRPVPSAEPLLAYRLVNASPPIEDKDLLFLAAARHMKTALSSQGMFEAPAGTPAQIDVAINIEMRGPLAVYRTARIVPVYLPSLDADPFDLGAPVRYHTAIDRVVVYRKFLHLWARIAARDGAVGASPELWSVFVENEDESNDLLKYTGLMVGAAMEALGREAATKHHVVLTHRDG